jgi:hypothetical protein
MGMEDKSELECFSRFRSVKRNELVGTGEAGEVVEIEKTTTDHDSRG